MLIRLTPVEVIAPMTAFQPSRNISQKTTLTLGDLDNRSQPVKHLRHLMRSSIRTWRNSKKQNKRLNGEATVGMRMSPFN